jgi:hypothetical protein
MLQTTTCKEAIRKYRQNCENTPSVPHCYGVSAFRIIKRLEPPVILPTPGQYVSSVNIQVSSPNSDADEASIVCYVDGIGNKKSFVYNGMFSLVALPTGKVQTVYCQAVSHLKGPSEIVNASYTVLPPADTPSFFPNEGAGIESMQVQIKSGMGPKATIFYSVNGKSPFTQYSGPISIVTTDSTIAAFVRFPGMADSNTVVSGTYLVSTAKPTISPMSATVVQSLIATVTPAFISEKVYCTLDGSDPTPDSPPCSSVTVTVTGTVLKAIAVKPDLRPSEVVASNPYIIKAYPPSISPSGGMYVSEIYATISSAQSPTAKFYFTTDGTMPTESSEQYSGPVRVFKTGTVVSAIAVDNGMANSDCATSQAFQVKAIAPTIILPEGPYVNQVDVAIQTSYSDATIYYTLDGTTPSRSSLVYSSKIPVVRTGAIISAIVTTGDKLDSSVTSAGPIGISADPPTFDLGNVPYIGKAVVFIQSMHPDAKIFYTLDNSNPTVAAYLYDPLKGVTVVASSTVIRAIVKTPTLGASAIASSEPIHIEVAPPQIQPNGGSFVNQVAVTITTATQEADIRYSLDGSTPSSDSPLYSGPISVTSTNIIVKAIAIKSKLDPSIVSSSSLFVIKAAAPTILPSGGSFDGPVSVAVSTSTAGADIRCTLDGSTPTDQTPVCTMPLVIENSGTVVSAVATKDGLTCSDPTTMAGGFVVRTMPVIFTPNGGTYTDQVSVVMSSLTNGALIFYTSDGSTPTLDSTPYIGAVTVSKTGFPLRAVALGEGKDASTPSTSKGFTLLASVPSFSATGIPWNLLPLKPGQLDFVEDATVTISCQTVGARIYYTVDNSEPTEASTRYTDPVSIRNYGPNLLRARAFADGLTPSPIAASLVYDIFARAAMPDILPRGPGPFVTSVTVTLKATTASIIYYTLDGSDPVAGTSEVYKAPILINSFTTTAVKALASKPGFADSLVSSASYLVLEQVVAPVIHVEGGPTFTQSAKFLISCATDGAVIHYTLDGSDPTAASPAYNEDGLLVALEPGDLAARVFSVKAIAIKAPSMGDSAVVSAGPFRVQPQVAAPIIAPDSSGPFLDSVLVSMTCSTPSASIYYTTDGSAPLVSPTAAVYTKPLALKGLYPATNAVVAVATKFGFTPSASVTASWIVETQACRPVINLAAGTYIAGVPVSISCAGTAPIGTVRYTIDGASPDAAAALTYAGPFPLDQPGTYVVRAVAIGDHLFSSPTVLSGEIEVREDPSCQANFYSDQRQTARCTPFVRV